MAGESRTPVSNDPHEVYRTTTTRILDDWKSGVISSTEAHQQHDELVSVLVNYMYNAWHTRMAVLDAWCTTHPVAPRRRVGQ